MRSATVIRVTLAGLLAVMLSAVSAEAGASRTRPGHKSHPSARRTSAPARRPAPSAPRRASGHATYGHYGSYGSYVHHRYPYFVDYGWYPGVWWSGFWAWPYDYGWGWYYGASADRPFWVYEEALGVPGLVETDVRPRKATVRLDGEAVGQASDYNGTWDHLRVEPGEHLVEFEAKGFMTLRTYLDVRPGRAYRLEYRLRKGEGIDPRSEPARAPRDARQRDETVGVDDSRPPAAPEGVVPGFLRILVSPRDAAVYLDGEFLARGDELSRLHGAIPVARGPHRIEVVRPGYRDVRTHVDVDSDEPTVLELVLERQE